jgi:hypothetical protein
MQLWKIRLPDGRVLEPGDWTTAEPLYSTVEIAPGPITNPSAFSYGRNGDVPGSPGPRKADIRDTNLPGEGGKIPENEELVIYSIHVEAFQVLYGATYEQPSDDSGLPVAEAPEVSLQDMLRLQRDIVLVTKIAAIKNYTFAPLSYFPQACGTFSFGSARRNMTGISASAIGAVLGSNGGSSVQDQRLFASPLYVGPSDVFSVEFVVGPGEVTGLSVPSNGRIRLRTFLDGYRRRPVA